MSGHFITAALLAYALLACSESHTPSTVAASTADQEKQSVTVLGYRITKKTVTFQIESGECESESDYEVTWLESIPSQVLLTRKANNNCSGKKSLREISFPAQEGYFTVGNPVNLKNSSYDCSYQTSSPLYKLPRMGSDILEIEETVNLAIDGQGCSDGTNLSLTKWTEKSGGITGQRSRDIQTKKLCVRDFGRQAGVLPGENAAIGIRVSGIDNGVVSTAELTPDIHKQKFTKSLVLRCQAR